MTDTPADDGHAARDELHDPAPSRDEVEDADLVLIGPFESDNKAAYRSFRARVIDPAIKAAEELCNRKISAVLVNGLVEHRGSDLELALRLMHNAPLCIADVTDCDHRALSYLSMRLVISKGRAIGLDRTRSRVAYPLPIEPIVRNAAPAHEGALEPFLRNAIKTAIGGGPAETGHPVFGVLPALGVGLKASPGYAGKAAKYSHYRLVSRGGNGPRVAIAKGDIRKVQGVDVWINPENTRMEMARVFDPSISGTIRHLSSNWTRSRFGPRSDDFMCRQLAQRQQGEEVKPGTAILTFCSGDLRRKNKVRAVVHVAAVRLRDDSPGSGYVSVEDDGIDMCVKNGLKAVDAFNSGWNGRLRTVIIPLIGTANTPETAARSVRRMVDAVVSFFETDAPASRIEGVALLAYTDEDERLVQRAFRARQNKLEPLASNPDLL